MEKLSERATFLSDGGIDRRTAIGTEHDLQEFILLFRIETVLLGDRDELRSHFISRTFLWIGDRQMSVGC